MLRSILEWRSQVMKLLSSSLARTIAVLTCLVCLAAYNFDSTTSVGACTNSCWKSTLVYQNFFGCKQYAGTSCTMVVWLGWSPVCSGEHALSEKGGKVSAKLYLKGNALCSCCAAHKGCTPQAANSPNCPCGSVMVCKGLCIACH
jgi:hypothetical protein